MWTYHRTSSQRTGGSRHNQLMHTLLPQRLETTFAAECHSVPRVIPPLQQMPAASSHVHGHQVALVTYSIPIRLSSRPTKHTCGNSGTLLRVLKISRGSSSKPFMRNNHRPEYRFSPSILRSRIRHYHWIFVCSCLRGRLPTSFVRFSA